MGLLRMDNIGIVVEDLDAAITFFEALGLELEGRGTVEGAWVDRCIGIDGTRCEMAMLRMPDGRGRVELSRFLTPAAIAPTQPATVNTLGMGRIMFAVDDLDATVKRLQTHGAELVADVVRYEDVYLLCYLRGPEGILVALAQEL